MNKKQEKSEYGRFETLNHWRNKLSALAVSPSARLVWYVLWSHADQRGKCSLSFRAMATETGFSDRGCRKFVRELIEKKIIKIVKSGNFQGEKNVYAIAVVRKKSAKPTEPRS